MTGSLVVSKGAQGYKAFFTISAREVFREIPLKKMQILAVDTSLVWSNVVLESKLPIAKLTGKHVIS